MTPCLENSGLTVDLSALGGSSSEPVIVRLTVDTSSFGGNSFDPVTCTSFTDTNMSMDLTSLGGTSVTPLQGQFSLPGFSSSPESALIDTLTLTFDALGINSLTIAYVYSWGMGVVLLSWSLGYAVSAVISIIKKL